VQTLTEHRLNRECRQVTSTKYETFGRALGAPEEAQSIELKRQRLAAAGASRTVYRRRPEVAAEFASQCKYVEQGGSNKAGAQPRPLFEQMKRDAGAGRFDPNDSVGRQRNRTARCDDE
jgi:hypothetical protein